MGMSFWPYHADDRYNGLPARQLVARMPMEPNPLLTRRAKKLAARGHAYHVTIAGVVGTESESETSI